MTLNAMLIIWGIGSVAWFIVLLRFVRDKDIRDAHPEATCLKSLIVAPTWPLMLWLTLLFICMTIPIIVVSRLIVGGIKKTEPTNDDYEEGED